MQVYKLEDPGVLASYPSTRWAITTSTIEHIENNWFKTSHKPVEDNLSNSNKDLFKTIKSIEGIESHRSSPVLTVMQTNKKLVLKIDDITWAAIRLTLPNNSNMFRIKVVLLPRHTLVTLMRKLMIDRQVPSDGYHYVRILTFNFGIKISIEVV